MYAYIVCPECGRPIGDYYDAFKEIRLNRYSEALGNEEYDPYILPIVEMAEVEMGDVLDSFGFTLDCCRAHMLCQREFKDVY